MPWGGIIQILCVYRGLGVREIACICQLLQPVRICTSRIVSGCTSFAALSALFCLSPRSRISDSDDSAMHQGIWNYKPRVRETITRASLMAAIFTRALSFQTYSPAAVRASSPCLRSSSLDRESSLRIPRSTSLTLNAGS